MMVDELERTRAKCLQLEKMMEQSARCVCAYEGMSGIDLS